jgi:phosphomannomutase
VFRDRLLALLEEFGAECVPLGRETGFVAVDTEAVSGADAARIADWVREHRLSALVSTDGDADRPLVADDKGFVVRGDVLGILTARYLGVPAVVTPVTSTSAVESSGFFRPVIRTRVGSPYVLAGMEQARLSSEQVVGFEANGGVLLGTPVRLNYKEIAALPTRDAMLPILSVLGLAQQTGQTLHGLVATLPPRFSRSGRLEHVPAERSEALLDMLDEAFFGEVGEVKSVGDLDGVRVSFESGDVIHFRPSGNAPELRCYSEADTPERAEWLVTWGLGAAERVVR